MWRPYGGEGPAVGVGGEEDKIRGGGLRRASEARRERVHLNWPRDTIREKRLARQDHRAGLALC